MILLATAILASCALLSPAITPPLEPPQDPPLKEPTPRQTPAPDAILYHTLTGRDAQVVFTSDAPLEQVVGKSNAVVGYAIAGPKDQPAKLADATWILPIKSLATGIPLRDQHLAGKEWLDAETYPNIQFVLKRVGDIKEIKRGDGFTTWSATLTGDMTIHGITHELNVADARLSFFQESPKTRAIAAGDLLFLKCEYAVKLSDFGIQNPDVPKKVSDSVKLTQTLKLSTVLAQVPKGPDGEPAKEPGKETSGGLP